MDSGSETGGIDVTTAGLPMMLPEIPLHASISGALQAEASAHQQLQPPTEVGRGPSQHETAEQPVAMADVGSAVPVTPEELTDEPSAKRARLSVNLCIRRRYGAC